MLGNYHTHTSYCDGKDTPEEYVLTALEKGFDAIGFSGHSNTYYDLSYCMTDTEGYIREINRLKEKYKNDIQIYLGIEEDIFSIQNREDFDYIIGAEHYISNGEAYFSIDSGKDCLDKCIEVCKNDPMKFAKLYFMFLCDYIERRKPDIVGHFDLLTKYEESESRYFFGNDKYYELAEQYICEALKHDVIFEINSGAVSRGVRKTPYPDEKILRTILKNDGKIIISSDCHAKENLDFGFEDMKLLLKDIGFTHTYMLWNGEFTKVPL